MAQDLRDPLRQRLVPALAVVAVLLGLFGGVPVARYVGGLTAWRPWNLLHLPGREPRSSTLVAAVKARGAKLVPSEGVQQAALLSDSQAAPGDFHEDCIRPLRDHRYSDALAVCERFTADAQWAGKAHATLAVIYMGRLFKDYPAAAQHAHRAVELGDAHGRFVAAILMQQGHWDAEFDLKQVLQWLTQARDAQVHLASDMLKELEARQACRDPGKHFSLFELPLFCMYQAEIHAALRAKGLHDRQLHGEAWTEDWQPGTALPGVRNVKLLYDEDQQNQIPVLVRVVCELDPDMDGNAVQLLAQALSTKYGKPLARHEQDGLPSQLSWPLIHGVEVEFRRMPDGNAVLSYSLAGKASEREAHLLQDSEMESMVRVQQLAGTL